MEDYDSEFGERFSLLHWHREAEHRVVDTDVVYLPVLTQKKPYIYSNVGYSCATFH
jgi:hypothetical protein